MSDITANSAEQIFSALGEQDPLPEVCEPRAIWSPEISRSPPSG
jgi:hypothetical protein